MLSRRVARPLLAAIFVSGGIDVLRNPGPRVQRAEPVTTKLAQRIHDHFHPATDGREPAEQLGG